MQIHFPFPTFKQSVLADGLKEAIDLGLTGAVGVCNYDAAQLEEMHGLLDKNGIALATNQVFASQHSTTFCSMTSNPLRDGSEPVKIAV